MIKFNKHHVTNGTVKARCFYSVNSRTDGRNCVTIYAKDYGSMQGGAWGNDLEKIFNVEDYANDTDTMTDYFDKGKVVLFEDNALFPAALKRATA